MNTERETEEESEKEGISKPIEKSQREKDDPTVSLKNTLLQMKQKNK